MRNWKYTPTLDLTAKETSKLVVGIAVKLYVVKAVADAVSILLTPKVKEFQNKMDAKTKAAQKKTTEATAFYNESSN